MNDALLNFLFNQESEKNSEKILKTWKTCFKRIFRIIYKGSFDIEDWNNDCWKFSFGITGKKHNVFFLSLHARTHTSGQLSL